jgi:HAD superfamily hydrolase (TIGR01549 family)
VGTVQPVNGVLLDVDGTLVDSTYHHAMAWHRAFARCGLDVPVWRIHRAIGTGGDRLVAQVAGAEVEDEHGDEVRAGWREEYAAVVDQVRPLPGAADLVRRLVDEGYAVALASSGESEFTDLAVATLGIGGLVAAITSSDDARSSKPDPDILLATLDRMGGVERAVVVGDTPYDVEAAGHAGLRCLTVLSGGYGPDELDAAGAALVVESPADLIQVDFSAHVAVPSREGKRA